VLGTVSAIRGISRVVNVSTSEYKKLVNMAGTGSGWVGEEDSAAGDRHPDAARDRDQHRRALCQPGGDADVARRRPL
jgi:hypothetical protein